LSCALSGLDCLTEKQIIMADGNNAMSIQGSLSLGETGFNLIAQAKHLLSVCTSDGVTETTLKFMDAFGAAFPVSSQCCTRVREASRTDRKTILGELKISVGYRRGDSASILAQSTSGLSSIAFIVAATELFGNEDIAWIMAELARGELPPTISIPTARELMHCKSAIDARCHSFNYTQHYANTVTAIRRTRVLTNTEGFDNLTTFWGAEESINLIRTIFTVLKRNGDQLRIEGSQCMGLIGAMITWWFPDNALVISENQVIWPCKETNPKYHINVTSREKSTSWGVVSVIDSLSSLLPEKNRLPLLTEHFTKEDIWPDTWLSHSATGFCAGALGSLGFPEGPGLELACSLVATLAVRLANEIIVSDGSEVQGNKYFSQFLSEDPLKRQQLLNHYLSTTTGCMPVNRPESSSTLLNELDRIVREAVSGVFENKCSPYCGKCAEDLFSMDWSIILSDQQCPKRSLRVFLIELIWKALFLCLCDVEDGCQVTIGSRYKVADELVPLMIFAFDKTLKVRAVVDLETITSTIGSYFLAEDFDLSKDLGSSNYGITVYLPAAFWPNMQTSALLRFTVAQGNFIYRDNYYQSLQCGSDEDYISATPIHPSSYPKYGGITRSQYYIREGMDKLTLKIKIEDCDGLYRNVHLLGSLRGAILVDRPPSCHHSLAASVPPQSPFSNLLFTTVVATSSLEMAHKGQVYFIYARGDPKSALYGCDQVKKYSKVLFIDDCCLPCAGQYCWQKYGNETVVIVSIANHGF
jgi:hypothetical protein